MRHNEIYGLNKGQLVINGVIRQYINAPDYMINMWLSPEWEREVTIKTFAQWLALGRVVCLEALSTSQVITETFISCFQFHFFCKCHGIIIMNHDLSQCLCFFFLCLLFFCLIYSPIYANSWLSLVSSASLALHWAQHLITSFLLHLPFAMSLLLLIRFANATGFPPCNLEKITAASSFSSSLLLQLCVSSFLAYQLCIIKFFLSLFLSHFGICYSVHFFFCSCKRKLSFVFLSIA